MRAASSSVGNSSASMASSKSAVSPAPFAVSCAREFGATPYDIQLLTQRRAGGLGRQCHQIVVACSNSAQRHYDCWCCPTARRGLGQRRLQLSQTGQDHSRASGELWIAGVGQGVDRCGEHLHRRLDQADDDGRLTVIGSAVALGPLGALEGIVDDDHSVLIV